MSPRHLRPQTVPASIVVALTAALLFQNAVTGPHAEAANTPALGQRCASAQRGKVIAVGAKQLRCEPSTGGYVWRAINQSNVGFTPQPPTTAKGANQATGTSVWHVQSGSQAGYRMREIYVGGAAKSDAVGRSTGVQGTVEIAMSGQSLLIRSARIRVDVAQLKSDQARRDDYLRTDALQTDRFKEAAFEVTEPATVPAPPDGQPALIAIKGRLTLHGVTKPVSIDLSARRTGDIVDVVGSTRLTLADFDIATPVIPGFVSTDDTGVLEFALVLKR